MSMNHAEMGPEQHPRMRRAARALTGGFSVEALAAAAVIVLAILALADIMPQFLTPIATIVFGVALLIKSGTIASQISVIGAEEGGAARREVGTEMSTEMLGGIAGIVLGILAFIGLQPVALLSVAAIVFGGALLFGGRETYRVGQLEAGVETREEHAEKRAVKSSGGAEIMVGIAAVVLGILALTGFQPMILILVSLLALGAVELLTGLAASGRFGSMLR